MTFKEKRIFLLQISSNLTATSARILFSSRLPLCRQNVLLKGGKWEQVLVGDTTYIMLLCDTTMLKEIEDTIQFVVKTKDITSNLINEQDYVFKPLVIKKFDIIVFIKAYTDSYLKEATLEYAQKKIKELGDKSRYIDHQILYNYHKKLGAND